MLAGRILGLILLLAVLRVEAATNEYYTSAKAKEVIDKVIEGYGGAARLKELGRLKLVMEMSYGERKMQITLAQSRDRLRRVFSGQTDEHLYDGTNVFIVRGRVAFLAPDALRDDVLAMVQKGIGQAALMDKYLNPTNQVRYLGKEIFEAASYEVIETLDGRRRAVKHYFDPKTYREAVEVTEDPRGNEVQKFLEYKEDQGIYYPARTAMIGPDGSTRGGMKLLEVTSNFDDDIFKTFPKKKVDPTSDPSMNQP